MVPFAYALRDFLLKEIPQGNQKIMAGELLFAIGRAALPPISPGKFDSTFVEFFESDLETVKSGFFKT